LKPHAGLCAGLLVAASLSACVTAPPPPPGLAARVQDLPGWEAEDHAGALAALQGACAGHATGACATIGAAGDLGEGDARRFFETHFRVQPVEGLGRLTAYFTPIYDARSAPSPEFSAPVRPRPAGALAVADRAEIEAAPATDALAWMRPEDLFLLQTQGSGVLAYPDGRRARAVFAGANGRAYVAIAGPMVRMGLLAAGQASADGVRGWLGAHRGAEADAVMRLNPRYVFFRLMPEDGSPVIGAAGAPLAAGRSLALDPSRHAFFDLFWIDADSPRLAGAEASYRRLGLALDRGGAIEGPARADLYLGEGAAAGEEAARTNHVLQLYQLVPAGAP